MTENVNIAGSKTEETNKSSLLREKLEVGEEEELSLDGILLLIVYRLQVLEEWAHNVQAALDGAAMDSNEETPQQPEQTSRIISPYD